MGLVIFVIAGAITGWLVGRSMQGRGFGLAADIATGVAGSLLGGVLFHDLRLDSGAGVIGILLVAAGGATALQFIVRLFAIRSGRVRRF